MPATLARPITGFHPCQGRDRIALDVYLWSSATFDTFANHRAPPLVIGCADDGFHRNCSRRVVDMSRRVVYMYGHAVDMYRHAVDSFHRNWCTRHGM